MTTESNLQYLHKVFTCARQLDDSEGLGVWPQKDGTILCGVWINDTFSWACAETEGINEDNVDAFCQACQDVDRVDPANQPGRDAVTCDMNCNKLHDAGVLFASRNRKLLPFKYKGEYPVHASVVPLLEAVMAPDSDCDKIWKGMGPMAPTDTRESAT